MTLDDLEDYDILKLREICDEFGIEYDDDIDEKTIIANNWNPLIFYLFGLQLRFG